MYLHIHLSTYLKPKEILVPWELKSKTLSQNLKCCYLCLIWQKLEKSSAFFSKRLPRQNRSVLGNTIADYIIHLRVTYRKDSKNSFHVPSHKTKCHSYHGETSTQSSHVSHKATHSLQCLITLLQSPTLIISINSQ